MDKTTAMTAKTFFKMADCDRKFLRVTSVITAILTVSMIIKLIISALCTVISFKK